MRTPHLVVALSSHGYGHAAMTAPVVAEMARRDPELRVTLLSTLPGDWLAQRFPSAGTVLAEEHDVTLVMTSPLDADRRASLQAYRDFHAAWAERVDAAAARLAAMRLDLVLCNVPYLPLAAAARARVPAAGLSSLNWLAVFEAYFGRESATAAIRDDMRAAYDAADVFLRCEPALPMAELGNAVAVGPVAEVGKDRRGEILAALGLSETTRLAVLSLGGRYPTPASCGRLPRISGLHWLLPPDWPADRPDTTRAEVLGDMPFADIVRSAAVLVTKPGYGLFTEAACAGTPVLCSRRGDWPEEPGLLSWLHRVGCCREIARQQLDAGDFGDDLAALLRQPRPAPVRPTGIAEAASRLLSFLR